MRFPGTLLRGLFEKTYDKAFDRGLFWGTSTGVLLTHFYYQDKMRKLRGGRMGML